MWKRFRSAKSENPLEATPITQYIFGNITPKELEAIHQKGWEKGFRTGLRKTLPGAPVGFATAILAFAGLMYYEPFLNEVQPKAPHAQIALRTARNSNLRLEAEQIYDPVTPRTIAKLDVHRDEIPKIWPTLNQKTLAHIFTDIYMKTCEELKTEPDIELLIQRAKNVSDTTISPQRYRDALQVMSEYAIFRSTTNDKVDLEDAAYILHLGIQSHDVATRLAASAEFQAYRQFTHKLIRNKATNQYELVPASEEQEFIRQFVFNIIEALPAKVQIRLDSSQPESGARAP